MDLHQIERAAEIVFKICREHPEICPHDYTWVSSSKRITDNRDIETTIYRCSLCGKEKTEIKDIPIK